jgi:hypothetical protein
MHAVIAGQTASGFGRYVDYFQQIQDAWKLVYRRGVPDATIPGDDLSYDRLTAPPHS